MIFRPTAKLAAKLKIEALETLPLDPNPLADWSATMFSANRLQYLLVANTRSLYSLLLVGQGLTNGHKFSEALIESLRNALAKAGLAHRFQDEIESSCQVVRFAKAHDRSVTGSMNDLVFHAKADLIADGRTSQDTNVRLNEIPFSSLDYRHPVEVFRSLFASDSEPQVPNSRTVYKGNKTVSNKKTKQGNSNAKAWIKAESPSSKTNEKSAEPTKGLVYHFKITIIGVNPPIWRRIQVGDITLDQLHECIQTAMGWFNSHLHQFVIKNEYYGDPALMDDIECFDSKQTKLSHILPTSKKRFSFVYLYDFGDSWEHEILYEGADPAESGSRYPLCLEGARACPPEDVGGIWGYEEFLKAMADPDHDEHESFLEWCGGTWDAEKFDPASATKKMKRGLPNWRDG